MKGLSKLNTKKAAFFAGSRTLEIRDEDLGISFPVLIHYPSLTPSAPTSFGPYLMDVSTDADLAKGKFPLVLLSHGNGGSNLIYRTISIYLAKNGYIVALPEHYGNNRRNNDLAQSVENLQYRPKHVRLTINHLIIDKGFGPGIDEDKIAVVGHSFGGYTALALAGGKPWTRSGIPVDVPHDPRIKALVLMAPASAYFFPSGSLAQVNLPILLLIAEHDEFTPQQWTSGIILHQVPDPSKVKWHVIKNAGHFSFISPFPAAMSNPNFMPSTDPQGFDREEFHRQLPGEILNFLNATL